MRRVKNPGVFATNDQTRPLRIRILRGWVVADRGMLFVWIGQLMGANSGQSHHAALRANAAFPDVFTVVSCQFFSRNRLVCQIDQETRCPLERVVENISILHGQGFGLYCLPLVCLLYT